MCALANVDRGCDAVAVFHVTPDGAIEEIWPDCDKELEAGREERG